jgi:uncharacterized delta-60 repeat protein
MQHWEPLDARRLFAFGSLDATFAQAAAGDDDGARPADTVEDVSPHRTLVQSDGRIVVAGRFDTDWALRRYMPDGSIDETFGDDGLFALGALLKSSKEISFLSQARDGGIFVGGHGRLRGEKGSSFGGAQTLLVAKVKADGTLDEDYLDDEGESNVGRAGFFRVGMNHPFLDTRAETIDLQRGGRIVVASGNRPGQIRVTRYTASGRLDDTFANNGRLMKFDVSGIPPEIFEQSSRKYLSYRYGEGITSIAEAPDGSVVAAGYYVYARSDGNPFEGSYAPAYLPYVLRISPSGAVIDSQILKPADIDDRGGSQRPGYTGFGVLPKQLEIDASGKIYMRDDGEVMRLNGDLTLDTTFGDGGFAPIAKLDGDDAADEPSESTAGADANLIGLGRDLFNFGRRIEDPTARTALERAADVIADVAALVAAVEGESLEAAGLAQGGPVAAMNEATHVMGAFADEATVGRVVDDEVDAASTAAAQATAVSWRGDAGLGVAPLGEALQLLDSRNDFPERGSSDATGARAGAAAARHVAGVGDGGGWTQDESSPYPVRLLSNRVADITGALAAGRTIGSLSVRVPEPVLQTTSVATSFTRERQHRLAPNH